MPQGASTWGTPVAGARDLRSRVEPFRRWARERLQDETWPLFRTRVDRHNMMVSYRDHGGIVRTGLDFASQDYLGLADDHRVQKAVARTAQSVGVHSAGPEIYGGNSLLSEALLEEMSDFLQGLHVLLFPTGWAAGYAAMRALVRPYDHVVADKQLHSSLLEGARTATERRHVFAHNDPAALRTVLQRIRREDRHGAIFVATETVFGLSSTGASLAALIEVAHAHDAYVIADCANDFGAMGESGLGALGTDDVLKRLDFIVGDFAGVFASTGGFFASKWAECNLFVQAFGHVNTRSDQLGPCQIAAIQAALAIVRSEEGNRRRRDLLQTATRLREAIAEAGLQVSGVPSPLVPVRVGRERQGRLTLRELAKLGVMVNFLEHPAVPLGYARLRFHLGPQHGHMDLPHVARQLRRAYDKARQALGGAAED